MSAAAIKPLSRRTDTLVVVRPIRLGKDLTLDVGTVIESGNFPELRRQFYWRLGHVGPQGHPWTERQLVRWNARIAREQLASEPQGDETPASETSQEPVVEPATSESTIETSTEIAIETPATPSKSISASRGKRKRSKKS